MADTYLERTKGIRIDHDRSAVNFKNGDLRWAYNEGHRCAVDDASQIAAEADAEIESLRAALDMATKKAANLHSALMAAGVPLEVVDRIMDGG